MQNLIKIPKALKQENRFVCYNKHKQPISSKTLKPISIKNKRNLMSFEKALEGLKNTSINKVISITYTKCGNLVFALKNDKVLSTYWHGKRPLKSEIENDYALMGKILFWVGYENIEVAIQYFLESPYTQQKDEQQLNKLLNTNYLEQITNEIINSKELEVI